MSPPRWSRGGSLCSLVPMQWLEGCQTGAFSELCSPVAGKKEALSHRGFQSDTHETLEHPATHLGKARVIGKFGPNPAAGWPSTVTPMLWGPIELLQEQDSSLKKGPQKLKSQKFGLHSMVAMCFFTVGHPQRGKQNIFLNHQFLNT